MKRERILGIVRNGLFKRLTPTRDPGAGCYLGRTKSKDKGKQGDRKAIDLAPYEGKALLIEGEQQELWVYDVRIIETAGPILSGLVQHVLGGGSANFESPSAENT